MVRRPMSYVLNHLQTLESEAIHIMREVVAEFENPVMLWSVGKDSSCLLRLAQKAFHPGPIPFPLMHVDTGYKFPAMYEFRDRAAKEMGFRLIVESNHEAIAAGAHPHKLGVARCCGYLKTQGLLDGLEKHGFDAAIGGARREEERSRAKERVFSFRDEFGAWDPKNQRPELWDLYNTRVHEGESIRVFPLSNWTEADIWQYIRSEEIPIVPLYYAAKREVVHRDGVIIPAWDRRAIREDEVPNIVEEEVRFRTLGCMPCTGAICSSAATVEEIVAEALTATRSERETRVIDHGSNTMEDKKREGYF